MPTIAESTKPFDPKVLEPVEPIRFPRQFPGSEPAPVNYPRFGVNSLPLSTIYQPDALRQFYRGGVPQQRIFPVQG